MKNTRKGLRFGILSGMLWGLDTVLISAVLGMSPFIETENAIFIAPFISTFVHDIFSSIWILIYNIITRQTKDITNIIMTNKNIWIICLASLMGGPIGMTSYLLAVKYIGASYTASISSIYPIVAVLWAHILLKDKINKKGLLGLLLSVSALILLGYSGYEATNREYNIGILLAMMCVLGWSLESVMCSYVMKHGYVNPIQLLQIRQVISSIVYLIIIIPLLNGMDLVIKLFKSSIILDLAIISMFGTISYIFYYKSIDKIGAIKATTLNITYSLWAIIFGVIILGDNLTIKLIICSLAMIIGSIMVYKN